jgi:hypothetical protein
MCVSAATADAGTINAGLVAASEAKQRGAFLAVQALSGFGASAVTPMLFGFVLDLAWGSGREAAWIAAFAKQAASARPGRWFAYRAVPKLDKQFCHDRTEPIAVCRGSGCACRRRQNCLLSGSPVR